MISVVMPVFNGAAFLEPALASIIGQSETEWELVAVDDGSTDAGPAILANAAAQDGRIRVLRRQHRGIVAALDAGIDAARGSLIARMDADDISRPERLARQKEFLLRHPHIGLVGGVVAYGGDEAANQGFARYVDWSNGLLDPESIYLNRFVESPMIHPSVMFRREIVRRHGGYRQGDFPEDYELWLRWLEQGVRMAKLDYCCLSWRERDTRLSRVHPRYSPEAFYRCKTGYLARWLAGRGIEEVVVWGAGRRTRSRAALLAEHEIAIRAYVDIDPRKIGNRIGGLPVWDKSDLPEPGACFLLSYVGSRGARDEIAAWLAARGYRPGRHYLLAA